jgi:hypothetical protein
MFRVIAATAAAAGLLAAGGTIAVDKATEPGAPGPSHAVYSFVHALKHENFGRACSYLSQDLQDSYTEGVRSLCGYTLFGSVVVEIMMGGPNPYDYAIVVAGSEKCDGDVCTYKLGFRDQYTGEFYGAAKATVKKQESGRYRITDIT